MQRRIFVKEIFNAIPANYFSGVEQMILGERDEKMIEKLFQLTWKKGCIIALAFMVMIIVHNLISVLYKADNACDAITFIIALYVIPAYLIICIVYSAIKRK